MKKILQSAALLLLMSAVAFAGEIKVGIIAPLSGNLVFYGKTTSNGMMLAIEEANAAGGVNGDQIKLVVDDNKGDSAESVTIAKKMINLDGVSAILGPVVSTNCLAVAPIAQESKVPMLTATGTNVKVTDAGDYVARVCFIDPFQGQVMANFAIDTLGAKKAAIMKDQSSDYGKGLASEFAKVFKARGGKIVTEVSYVGTDVDYTAQLTKIRSKKPDVIFVPGYQEIALIAKQKQEFRIKAPILGGDGMDSTQLIQNAGDAIEGSFCSTHFSAEDQSPMIQNFLSNYKARFGEDPSVLSALGYDAGKVLVEAIKKAGTDNPTAIKDAINATAGFKGVTGTITLDEKRNAVKSAFVLEVKDGKLVYKTTVEPK